MHKLKKIHISGIGGSAASGVALYLKSRGFEITGSDLVCTEKTHNLEKAGIKISYNHQSENIQKADLLLLSAAVLYRDAHNPEIEAAREKGISIKTWQEFMPKYLESQGKIGIMAAGAGGKGSVASMVAEIMIKAGLDPLCLLGAESIFWGTNFYLGKGDYYIMEADEFNRNFLNYHPQYVVITSMIYEHPETYKSLEEYKQAFAKFAKNMSGVARLGVSQDSRSFFHQASVLPEGKPHYSEERSFLLVFHTPAMLQFIKAHLKNFKGKILTYGENPQADYFLADLEQTTFGSSFKIKNLNNQKFILKSPCRYAALNALAAIGLISNIGIDIETAHQALAKYQGLKRRFEVKHRNGITLIFDYAHAPKTIKTTLSEAKRIFPDRRLIAVFQPHMYSRTYQFLDEFAQSFSDADQIILMDIFPSREQGTDKEKIVSSRDLSQKTQACHASVKYIANPMAQVSDYLNKIIKKDDVVVMLGAGDISEIYEQISSSFPK